MKKILLIAGLALAFLGTQADVNATPAKKPGVTKKGTPKKAVKGPAKKAAVAQKNVAANIKAGKKPDSKDMDALAENCKAITDAEEKKTCENDNKLIAECEKDPTKCEELYDALDELEETEDDGADTSQIETDASQTGTDDSQTETDASQTGADDSQTGADLGDN